MNQILSVENNKKKKQKSGIHSILVVFSIILIIFGIGLTSTGAYSYYRNLSSSLEDNVATSGKTKPVITIERVNASTINIDVTHDKGITNVTYKINENKEITIDGENKMEVKQEVELPVGESTISITAEDIDGITSSYKSTNTVENKPTIKLEQDGGRIKATVESKNANIDYIAYYWDEDEANAKQEVVNDVQKEIYIDVLEGTHTLNIIVADETGAQTKKAQKIIGDNKPKIEVKTNGKVFRVIATDDEEVTKIETTLNSNETETEEVNQKEYTKDITLENGTNQLKVTVYNKNGLTETTTVEYVKE